MDLAGLCVCFYLGQVLADKFLGHFHTPPLCPAAGLGESGASLPMDCVEAGCDGLGCVYRLALPHDPGTFTGYTLQVGVP